MCAPLPPLSPKISQPSPLAVHLSRPGYVPKEHTAHAPTLLRSPPSLSLFSSLLFSPPRRLPFLSIRPPLGIGRRPAILYLTTCQRHQNRQREYLAHQLDLIAIPQFVEAVGLILIIHHQGRQQNRRQINQLISTVIKHD